MLLPAFAAQCRYKRASPPYKRLRFSPPYSVLHAIVLS
jgi:hypothetical protein